ncbi:glycosyltransferase family 2 protein [Xylona heveae TC161]|uniref:chitin synthase n=1 Tax=Xylona heveae (strain CBS 132557 / TC161) TaxID=1328760 RepID=A0A165JDC8_XYLHT|nr:glycosyltransferase family 2 protein [Xylona heveae TC161]KZF26088.1 glycosyltransferase family 2 protein [Xylona heveae TC161]
MASPQKPDPTSPRRRQHHHHHHRHHSSAALSHGRSRSNDVEAGGYSPPRGSRRDPYAYQPASPGTLPGDRDPIMMASSGPPVELGRKRSLIRPERNRIDRDHPNYHYRQHAQNMNFMPSTTGNDPLIDEHEEEALSSTSTEMASLNRPGQAAPVGVAYSDSSPSRSDYGHQRGESDPVPPGKLKRRERKKQQKQQEAVTPPSLWNIYCHLITFWCPDVVLGCFGMPAKAQKRAWREKMGLISIILLIGTFVGFLTFGFTEVVCGSAPARMKVNHVEAGYMIFHGSAYDLSKSKHPPARGIPENANVLYDLPEKHGGQDGSFLFQNVNGACKGLITKAKGSDVPSNSNGELAWYFPCNTFNQDGSSKPNTTDPYYLGYACHTTANSRKAFYDLKSSGQVYFTWDDIKNSSRNLMVYSGDVLDLDLLQWFNTSEVSYPAQFDDLRKNPAVRGTDVTRAFQASSTDKHLASCLTEIIRVGSIDTETVGCIASKVVLYVSLIFILSIVVSKFVLAVAFGWFLSRRYVANGMGVSKKRNQEIEDWTEDIYQPPPRYGDTMVGGPDKGGKRGSTLLPKTSRFTSPYAVENVAKKQRPTPTTMASQSSTARLLANQPMYSQTDGSQGNLSDPTSKLSHGTSRSSLMLSQAPETRFSALMSDVDAVGPTGFIHENVVPQPPPEWQPFGYPLAHTICLVTAYSEGVEGLRTTLDSLATTDYPNSHKALLIICDGIIKGHGETMSTPDAALSMLKDHAVLPDEVQPYSYVAVAGGSKRHNMAKVYAGFYDYGEDSVVPADRQQRVPMMVVVKCGTPQEAEQAKPGNRGKRDSQIIIMSFLQKVMFDERMTELEYEMFNGLWRITGISPDFYEIMLMVDADTKVFPDCLTHMVSAMVTDPEVMGLCGETKIANKTQSWVSMIQVFEYFISHHQAKSFESVFGGVTCLPGCFCMYRIKAPKGGQNYWVPILANPDVVEHYSENVVDTLHKKNLLLLGEDRYLSTLMLKTFPKRKQIFLPQAVCKTVVPDKFMVLLSQRRRWINSTVHNLMELVLVRDLCGTFCFSMQFVVFIELIGTLVLPAAISFTVYLIVISFVRKPVPVIPLTLLALILGLPGILIVLTAHRLSYILWMLIYLISLPIWNFVLPTYAYWKFDDFSWGDTRKTAGETKKGDGHDTVQGEFDSSKITMKRWADYERGE